MSLKSEEGRALVARHATLGGTILRVLGNEVTIEDTSIIPDTCSCRSSAPTIRVLAMLLLNLVRTANLFYVELGAPAAFEIVHRGVWEPLLHFPGHHLWALWAWRITRKSAIAGRHQADTSP